MVVHLAVAGDVFDGVFLCCPFSPRNILDEFWDCIGPVSENFPTYSCKQNKTNNKIKQATLKEISSQTDVILKKGMSLRQNNYVLVSLASYFFL